MTDESPLNDAYEQYFYTIDVDHKQYSCSLVLCKDSTIQANNHFLENQTNSCKQRILSKSLFNITEGADFLNWLNSYIRILC